MTTKWLGRGLGTALMVLAFVGITSVTAYADGTCYVACSPPTTSPGSTSSSGGTTGTTGTGGKIGTGGGLKAPVTKAAGGSASSGSGAKTASQLTAASGGSLPFTGADIEEMTIGGIGALLIGGVLLRRSRNRRRATA